MNKRTMMFFIYLSLWVIGLFSVAMMWSYITEHTLSGSDFFSDYRAGVDYEHPDGIRWGWRHILFNTMSVVLFGISVIRIATWSIEYFDHKPQKK